MIRIDSHFHPNFNFLLPEGFHRRHALRLWKEFARSKLDVVFVTEHSYKHPLRSYETLLRYRPADATTILIPGIEALTKEGMDAIVFSRDEYLYTCKDIMTPWKLTMDTLLSRVCRDKRLFVIIPHPFIPCRTGLIHHRNREATKECIRRAHYVEKYNASLRSLSHLMCCLGLCETFKGVMRRLQQTADVPPSMIEKGVLIFGGSDAHHWWDIGTHLVIHARKPKNFHKLFSVIIGSRHKRRIVWGRQKIPSMISFAIDTISVVFESARKRMGIWTVDALTRNHAMPAMMNGIRTASPRSA